MRYRTTSKWSPPIIDQARIPHSEAFGTSAVIAGYSVGRGAVWSLWRPFNVGRRLADLATAAGCEVTMETTDTQIWTRWNPDESPAPDGCFSMASLADDLVEKGQLESGAVSQFVGEIHAAARRRRFTMPLTMRAVIAVRS